MTVALSRSEQHQLDEIEAGLLHDDGWLTRLFAISDGNRGSTRRRDLMLAGLCVAASFGMLISSLVVDGPGRVFALVLAAEFGVFACLQIAFRGR